MRILKMQAFGDFDTPYDVNVASGDDVKIQKACNILNEFCKTLPGCDQDINLGRYLENREDRNKLQYLLIQNDLFTPVHAVVLVNEIQRLCDIHSAYVYGNMFAYEDIVQI